MNKLLNHFFYAWIFLTKLPGPKLKEASDKDWGRITPYFVLVGFVIGFIVIGFCKLFVYLKLPILFASLLTVFIYYFITGGLHLDGLMDSFDGIGCTSHERKLEAMKDSRIGSFGAMGGIFVVLFKLINFSTLLLNNLLIVILISIPLSRLHAVYSLSFLSKNNAMARSSSLIASGVKKPMDFLINTFCFLIIFLLFFIYSHLNIFYIIFIITSFFLSLGWIYWFENHFKGQSGDTYGALIELSEITTLIFRSCFQKLLDIAFLLQLIFLLGSGLCTS